MLRKRFILIVENPFLIAQILNLGLLLLMVLAPILTLLALIGLRRRPLTPGEKGIWAVVIMVPLLGPLAFWIVNP